MPALIFILVCLLFVIVNQLYESGHTKVLKVMGHTIRWCSFIGGFFAGTFFWIVWLIGAWIGTILIDE